MSKSSLLIALIVLIFILLLRFSLFYATRPTLREGQNIVFTTVVQNEPKIFGTKQYLTARLSSGERIYVTTNSETPIEYGDKVKIDGELRLKQLGKKTIFTMVFPTVEMESKGSISILSLTTPVRQEITDFFERSFSQIHAGLMLGIVFGVKDSLPKDFSDQLKATGVFHVVAASGMNVAILGGFLSAFLALFLDRKVVLLFTILGIVFYASLASFEPSIVRASIMGILVFSSQALGRQHLASVGLILTGFIMLIVNPLLISDIGFQLSFLATAGILYLKPRLDSLFGKHKKKLILGDDLTTTISAQAATLPILLANFGNYSLWSIIVNLLVLWIVPVLMVIGGISAMLSFVFDPFARLFAFLSLPFLYYFEAIINFFDGLGGLLNLENIVWQIYLGYYLILIAVLLLPKRK